MSSQEVGDVQSRIQSRPFYCVPLPYRQELQWNLRKMFDRSLWLPLLLLVAASRATADAPRDPPLDKALQRERERIRVSFQARLEATQKAQRFRTQSSQTWTEAPWRIRVHSLIRRPEIRLEFREPPAWGSKAFEILGPRASLAHPFEVEIWANFRDFPRPGPADPGEMLDLYLEESHYGRFAPALTVARDASKGYLRVRLDGFPRGRLVLAHRMKQPFQVHRIPSRGGPEASDWVFLHGVNGNRIDYWGERDVLEWLRARARNLWMVQYPSGSSVAENGRRVSAWIEAFPALSKLRVFSYSMGGLVAREALRRPLCRARVERLVLLATPSRGAEWVQKIGFFPGLAELRDQALGSWEGLRDMVPGSKFLTRLAEIPTATQPPTLALAGVADGNGDLVVDRDSVELPVGQRPPRYHFRARSDFLNLNRLSHWGVHQEFRQNGFAEDLEAWLHELDCPHGLDQAVSKPQEP